MKRNNVRNKMIDKISNKVFPWKLWLLIGIACIFLVLPMSTLGQDNDYNDELDDYKPGFFEDYHGGDPLTNFIDPWLLRWHGSSQEPADMYGWYEHTFFTIAEWEREVCLADLSTDIRNVRNVVTGLDEIENVYMTTVTVAATKMKLLDKTTLYEVSWYIAPYNVDALYRVYLEKGSDKEYFAGNEGDDDDDWEDASQYTGDSNYMARYLEKDYNAVVLEYREGASSSVYKIVSSIAVKKIIE